ncbi:unnamed protein product [Clonostachys rosea]|uniref:Ankyrin repeat domain-containing protein n=1 Tax=Bionectria ochroleuca TaxID=29856 RepID=A0ABY6V0L9_BIOOC|nr:unnamed protein product [Clonostachys rosea]
MLYSYCLTQEGIRTCQPETTITCSNQLAIECRQQSYSCWLTPDLTGHYGTTLQAAYYRACPGRDEDFEIIDLLLSKGGDLNLQGGVYGNPLQAASLRGNEQIIKRLLSYGAQGGRYSYALCATSAKRYSPNIIKLLLKAGANINSVGGDYRSAVQAASYHGDKRTVSLSLKNNADLNIKGGKLGSALEIALEYSYSDIEKLLR